MNIILYNNTLADVDINISKKLVEKAGKKIKGRDDVNMSLDEAFNIMSEWRARHDIALNKVRDYIMNVVTDLDSKAYFGARLKREESIRLKLQRMSSLRLDKMQDIAGCRIIVSNIDVLNMVRNELLKNPDITERDDYIYDKNKIRPDGYKSIHFIYKHRDENPIFNNKSVEIQLRTALQHYWATAVEIIDIFEGEKLKIGQGTEQWKRFFYLVSEFFSVKEGVSSRIKNIVNIPSKSMSELFHTSEKINAIDKLTVYTGFSQFSEGVVDGNKYVIIVLSSEEKKINHYAFDNIVEARRFHDETEKKFITNNRVNVAMVKVSSVEELRKSYQNYFADSQMFIKNIDEITACFNASKRKKII